MFQEWLIVAVKLLLVACVLALVALMLLTRAACARLAAQAAPSDRAARSSYGPPRNGGHRLQAGV